MKRKMTRILLLTMAGMLLHCGGREHLASNEADSGRMTEVKAERAKTVSVPAMLEAVGTVRSKVTTTLSSKVVGHVLSVFAREGDQVTVGKLLAEVDSRDAQARIEGAEAGLQETEGALEEVERAILAAESGLRSTQANASLAESTHRRFQELLNRKSVSQQEFDEVQAKYTAATAEVARAKEMLHSIQARRDQVRAQQDQARAALASAELTLSYSRITSPINGLVTEKMTEIGQLAGPGTPLFTLEDGRHYRLEAVVEESRIQSISIGQPLRVRVDSLLEELESKVVEIVPAADTASRSFTVKVELPQNPRLRSGLFGRLFYPAEVRESLMVSASAIIMRGQLAGIYVIDDEQKARFRLVKTGKEVGKMVEVLSGVEDGDLIVVEALDRLSDGHRVKVIETMTQNFHNRFVPVVWPVPCPVLSLDSPVLSALLESQRETGRTGVS